jgi:glutathione S-transferase
MAGSHEKSIIPAMIPILYHYDISPYAELVRTGFGAKGLTWGSVQISSILPKPEQTLLTGGYGRTPVVQVGADIYCDTLAIIPALEALGDKTLYPAPLGPLHRMAASWANGPQFTAHVIAGFSAIPPDSFDENFIKDRQARFGMNLASLTAAGPFYLSQALASADLLSHMLADGRAFIGGDAPGAGDLAHYSNIWMVKKNPGSSAVADQLLALPYVADWYARVAGIGHGDRREMTSAEAVAQARAATPAPIVGTVAAPFVAGMMAAVSQPDTKDAPTIGRLLRCDAGGITVAREVDGEPGLTVHVHFPRLGHAVAPA